MFDPIHWFISVMSAINGSYQGRCVICGGPGVSDAYYCKECTVMQKDVSSDGIVLICREMV